MYVCIVNNAVSKLGHTTSNERVVTNELERMLNEEVLD
jgi:hypothetical protein